MAGAPTPWWVNDQLYTHIHKREPMPDLDRLQTLYIKQGGSEQPGLNTVVASAWEPMGRRPEGPLANLQRVSMRIVEAPAEFCMPVKQDRRLAPPFKVRMDVTLPQTASVTLHIKAQLITQQQKDNIAKVVPEEATGGPGEDKSAKLFTEMKGMTHLKHVFEANAPGVTVTGMAMPPPARPSLTGSSFQSATTPATATNQPSPRAQSFTPFRTAQLPPAAAATAAAGPQHQTPQGWPQPWAAGGTSGRGNEELPANDLRGTGPSPMNISFCGTGSLDAIILEAAGQDMLQSGQQQPGQMAAAVKQEEGAGENLGPLITLSHDFEFLNLELLKPTRMNQVYMLFVCHIDSDVLMLLYHVPTIGICRAEQRIKACAKLGMPTSWLPGMSDNSSNNANSNSLSLPSPHHAASVPTPLSMSPSMRSTLSMGANPALHAGLGSFGMMSGGAQYAAAAAAMAMGMAGGGGLPQAGGSDSMLHKLGMGGQGIPTWTAAGLFMVGPGGNSAGMSAAAAGDAVRRESYGEGMGVGHGGMGAGSKRMASEQAMLSNWNARTSDSSGIQGDPRGDRSSSRHSLGQGDPAGAFLYNPNSQSDLAASARLLPSLMPQHTSASALNGSSFSSLAHSGGNSGGNLTASVPLARPSLLQHQFVGGPGAGPGAAAGGGTGDMGGAGLLLMGTGINSNSAPMAGGAAASGNSGPLARMGLAGHSGAHPSGHSGQLGYQGNSMPMHSRGVGVAGVYGDGTGYGGGVGGAEELGGPMLRHGHAAAHEGVHGAGPPTGRADNNSSSALPVVQTPPVGVAPGGGGGGGGGGHNTHQGGSLQTKLSLGPGAGTPTAHGGSMMQPGLVVLGGGGEEPGGWPMPAHMAPPHRQHLQLGGAGHPHHAQHHQQQQQQQALFSVSGHLAAKLSAPAPAGQPAGQHHQQQHKQHQGVAQLGSGLLSDEELFLPLSAVSGANSQLPVSWEAMRDWIQDEYEAAAFSRKLTRQDMQALLSQAGFPPECTQAHSHVVITEVQGREFQQHFQTTVQLLRQIANLWNQEDPCVVAGFDMDRAGAVQALAREPPGTFLCRFSMSQPGCLVLSCKVDGDRGVPDAVAHVIIKIQDLNEKGADQWILDCEGATHCLDVYRGKRCDKYKVFATDITRSYEMIQVSH